MVEKEKNSRVFAESMVDGNGHVGEDFDIGQFEAPLPSSMEEYGAVPVSPPPDPNLLPYRGRRDWAKHLLRTSSGRVMNNLANGIHALEHAPELAGSLGYDEFQRAIIAQMAVPWDEDRSREGARAWTDNDDRHFAAWAQKEGLNISVRTAGDAAEAVSAKHKSHPVREYLKGLEWDGVRRLDGWLTVYLGAETNEYVRAVGAKWLLSGVARVMEPGCKADCVLILEGDQGLGKSRAMAVLANGWFTDRISEFRGKEAAQELSGVWLVELAELDAMDRSTTATVKAFLSRTSDRYRPPFGRRVEEFPRQCIFVGTVNPEDGYLRDPTGARRFWPVRCAAARVEELERDRDQLWAEALVRYRAGASWYLDTPELVAAAEEQQRERHVADPWDAAIGEHIAELAARTTAATLMISVEDVLKDVIHLERSRWTQAEQTRVAKCLIHSGFVRKKVSLGSSRKWRYVGVVETLRPTSPTRSEPRATP